MNVREEAAVKTFVEPSRQERFLSALGNPKKRSTFTNELNHLRSRFLVPSYIRPIKGADSFPPGVYKTLPKFGGPEQCWVIGGRFDGPEVDLLKPPTDSGDGFLLSRILGRPAFVKTEAEEFILSRT